MSTLVPVTSVALPVSDDPPYFGLFDCDFWGKITYIALNLIAIVVLFLIFASEVALVYSALSLIGGLAARWLFCSDHRFAICIRNAFSFLSCGGNRNDHPIRRSPGNHDLHAQLIHSHRPVQNPLIATRVSQERGHLSGRPASPVAHLLRPDPIRIIPPSPPTAIPPINPRPLSRSSSDPYRENITPSLTANLTRSRVRRSSQSDDLHDQLMQTHRPVQNLPITTRVSHETSHLSGRPSSPVAHQSTSHILRPNPIRIIQPSPPTARPSINPHIENSTPSPVAVVNYRVRVGETTASLSGAPNLSNQRQRVEMDPSNLSGGPNLSNQNSEQRTNPVRVEVEPRGLSGAPRREPTSTTRPRRVAAETSALSGAPNA